MKHIGMFRATLLALAASFACYAQGADSQEVEDPAANWAFTNHWTYGSKIAPGSKPGITDGTFIIRLASAWNKDGCLTIFENSSTRALSGGPGETIDLRNVMIGGIAVTNLSIGNFAFHGRNTYTNFYANHITKLGHSPFRDNGTALKCIELEGSMTTIGSGDHNKAYGLVNDCNALTNVVLRFPNCKKINTGYLFYNCTGLPELVLDLPKLENIPDYTFEYCSSLTNLVLRCPSLKTLGDYQRGIGNLKHLEISSTNVVSFGSSDGFLDPSFTLKTLTFGGVLQPQSTIDGLLKKVAAVSHTAEQTKNATVYVSKRKEWGWRDSGLIANFAGVEESYAPEDCLGVYRSGSRKAWVVHKYSIWDIIEKGFRVIVR